MAWECPQQNGSYNEINIASRESQLPPKHLRNLCLVIWCWETCCLFFRWCEIITTSKNYSGIVLMHDQDMRYSPPCEGKNNSMSMRITWFILTEKNMGNDINQSIKSSFVKGAGAHPQNAPCQGRSHAQRKAPVRRGRLLSTVLHRWSPRQSILSAGLR